VQCKFIIGANVLITGKKSLTRHFFGDVTFIVFLHVD
jgi:hypothetical protein